MASPLTRKCRCYVCDWQSAFYEVLDGSLTALREKLEWHREQRKKVSEPQPCSPAALPALAVLPTLLVVLLRREEAD